MKTKENFLRVSSDLFGHQGFSGTGLKQIVAEADGPWGSVYHFFPGGKDQLGAEAVRYAGERDNLLFEKAIHASPSASAAIALVFKAEMKKLKANDYKYGCAVASVASDVATSSEQVRVACSEVFQMWQATVSDALKQDGVPARQAASLSGMFLLALEGSTLLCRTHKSVTPMKEAQELICAAIDQAVLAAKK